MRFLNAASPEPPEIAVTHLPVWGGAFLEADPAPPHPCPGEPTRDRRVVHNWPKLREKLKSLLCFEATEFWGDLLYKIR